jgi:hypothetical protein
VVPFILDENIQNLKSLNALMDDLLSQVWDQPTIFEGSFESGGHYHVPDDRRVGVKLVTMHELDSIA